VKIQQTVTRKHHGDQFIVKAIFAVCFRFDNYRNTIAFFRMLRSEPPAMELLRRGAQLLTGLARVREAFGTA
jgi:hypothetical protein